MPPAPPWFIGNGCGPLNDAGLQALVEWQLPHDPLKAPPCDEGRLWHAAHELGVPANVPPLWHAVHSARVCAPVRRKLAKS